MCCLIFSVIVLLVLRWRSCLVTVMFYYRRLWSYLWQSWPVPGNPLSWLMAMGLSIWRKRYIVRWWLHGVVWWMWADEIVDVLSRDDGGDDVWYWCDDHCEQTLCEMRMAIGLDMDPYLDIDPLSKEGNPYVRLLAATGMITCEWQMQYVHHGMYSNLAYNTVIDEYAF